MMCMISVDQMTSGMHASSLAYPAESDHHQEDRKVGMSIYSPWCAENDFNQEIRKI